VLSLLATFIAWISVRPSVLKRLAKLSGKVQ